jgi:phage shock protein A
MGKQNTTLPLVTASLYFPQVVARAIATQKRTEQQYNKNQSEANTWQSRAQLALQKGNESLAREALVRKKAVADAAATLKEQLDGQTTQVDTLKRNLIALESKISEAKTKQDMLKSRASAAKANEQLQSTIGRLGTSSAMGAFERMEEKVLEMETRAQTSYELDLETRLRKVERELESMKAQLLEQQKTTSYLLNQNSAALEEVRSLLKTRSKTAYELVRNELEQQFKMLDSGSDVDDELAAMKAQLTGGSVSQQALPASEEKKSPASKSEVDDELESLRKQIDNL